MPHTHCTFLQRASAKKGCRNDVGGRHDVGGNGCSAAVSRICQCKMSPSKAVVLLQLRSVAVLALCGAPVTNLLDATVLK